MLKEVDIQEVCDQCCDSVHVNNQYIGEIFQWLVNNDFVIAKNEPLKLTDPKPKPCSACNGSGYYDTKGSPKCGACNGTGKEPHK